MSKIKAFLHRLFTGHRTNKVYSTNTDRTITRICRTCEITF